MKFVLTIAVLAVGLALIASSAFGRTVSCGDYKTYTDLRAKNTNCAVARQVAHAEYVYPHGIGGTHTLLGSWTCRASLSGGTYHHRCARGSAVVKFEEG
jgi:hypothetical protein